MMRVASLVGIVIALLHAQPVGAHLGAESFILVPAEHVLPGQPFTVIASDVTPQSTVSFELRTQTYSAQLGSHTAAADGHFETQLTLPPDAPTGYVELIGTSPDATSVSTWILVGPAASQTGPSPAASSGGGIDPSVVVLGVLLGGAVGGVGYLLLRPRRTLTRAVTDPPVKREPVPRKAARRREKR